MIELTGLRADSYNEVVDADVGSELRSVPLPPTARRTHDPTNLNKEDDIGQWPDR